MKTRWKHAYFFADAGTGTLANGNFWRSLLCASTLDTHALYYRRMLVQGYRFFMTC